MTSLSEQRKAWRNWRDRANDALRYLHSDIECWGDSHVLASLRNVQSPLWNEARDHGFFEKLHDWDMSH